MAGFETKPRMSARPHGCSEAEWLARIDLAACYRLADMQGMSKVIWNHITARVPDEPDTMLVFRFGCRYDEVTASNLVKMTLDGTLFSEDAGDLNTAAAVIHSVTAFASVMLCQEYVDRNAAVNSPQCCPSRSK